MRFVNLIKWIIGTGGITLTSLSLVTSAQAQQLSFNAANEFSYTNNPNGVWQYGYSAPNEPIGMTFKLYPDLVRAAATTKPVYLWLDKSWALYDAGNMGYNAGNNAVVGGTVGVQPAELSFHPGPMGEYSIIRWTAPSDGIYSVAARFRGLDYTGDGITSHGTSTDVHVLYKGSSLFDALVEGYGNASNKDFATTQPLDLKQGDYLDFAVGDGGNGFGYDTTGIDIGIDESSSPPTLAMRPDTPIPGTVPIPESSPLLGLFVVGTLGAAALVKQEIAKTRD